MESYTRSAVKAVSWRILASLTTGILAFLFTGSFWIAVSIGSTEAVAKIFLYWTHERLWDRIRWGRVVPVSSP